MKLSILALALTAQNASAFTTPSSVRTSFTQLASSVAEQTTTNNLDSAKYETDVIVDPKFKVANVDPKVTDPKKRVQT